MDGYHDKGAQDRYELTGAVLVAQNENKNKINENEHVIIIWVSHIISYAL